MAAQTQQVNIAGVVAKHWKDVAPTELYFSFRIRVLDSREIAVDAWQSYEMGRPSTLSFRTGVTPGGWSMWRGASGAKWCGFTISR